MDAPTLEGKRKKAKVSKEIMRNGVALLKAARKLDEEALIAIFDQFAPAIYKYALRLCHDSIVADNIVGAVFAQLLERIAAGTGPRTNLRSYLYQTAHHLVVDRSRANQRIAPLQITAESYKQGQLTLTPSQREERLMLEALVSALNTELTDEQRYVIILRFLEDFSLKETAEILGKDVNNIKVMQNRGIARLRKFLTLYSISQFTGDSTTDGWPPEMNEKGKEKSNDHET